MTWASIIASGNGRIVGFMLVVEGWPDVYVTHPAILWNSTDLQGRTVRNGLKSDGLGFGERLNLQDCMTQATGFTAKIVSASSDDPACASLSRDAASVGWLGASVTASGTTFSLYGGGTLADGYYHLATEVVRVVTWPTVQRQKWNTQAQAHNVTTFGEETAVPLYSNPPTMEGRRCMLYAYGDGDDLTALGTVVFRGIVTGAPTLASDGLTWQIKIGSRHSLLSQNVAAGANRAKLYGIHHHKASPFFIRMEYNGTLGAEYWVTGLHDTVEAMIAAINTELETARAAIPATNITYVKLGQDADGAWRIFMRTGGTAPNFMMFAGSPLLGYLDDSSATWFDNAGNSVWWEDITINTTYTRAFGPRNLTMEEFSSPATCLGIPHITPSSQPVNAGMVSDPGAAEDPWTIYLDKDLGTMTGEFVHISNANLDDNIFEVVSSTTTAYSFGSVYSLTLVPVFESGKLLKGKADGHFMGYLNGETEVTHIRDFGTGDVADFLAEILVNSPLHANDGEAPFLSANTNLCGDVATWLVGDAALFHFALTARKYRFGKAKSLREILVEEMKLIGHILYLDALFLMNIRRLPNATQVQLATTTIDVDSIITPFGGGGGSWPGWEPQRDGLVNHVEVQDGYDPVDDEWKGRTFVYRDLPSIAEHKTRGKGKLDVKPYSSSERMDSPAAALVSATLTRLIGRDYAIVTVSVPFTMFHLLIGDVVKLTHRLVPNGSGGRGVTTRRAIVVERKWKFDPKEGDEPGELALLIQRGDDGGYTPTGHITSQVDNGSNNWSVTLLHTNAFNQAFSQTGSGVVAEHFAAGDYIEIINVGGTGGGDVTGDTSETRVTGTVTSVSGNVVVVALDSTWTPGTDTWWIKWPKATGSNRTTHQQGFSDVADSTQLLANGTQARRFV